jgi:flagellar hook-associated protein 2
MAITFSGLATGLDTDSIVSDLMAVERAPLDALEAEQTSLKKRLDAYSQFDTRLDSLKTAIQDMRLTSQVRTTEVSLSSEDALSATSSGAETGSYNISVAQLSQVQKNISTGFESKTDSIFGTGSIEINGTNIAITSENNNVSDLVQSINQMSDTTGVKASIINAGDDGPYHIVFTGEDASTTFTLTSDLTGASGTYNFNDTEEVQSAQQAVVFIDGIKVVSDNNTISDAISGVNISLNDASETSYAGTAEEGVDPWDWADPPVYEKDILSVEADTDSLKEKITTFVTAYNDIMEWIASGYDEVSSTDTTDSEDEDSTNYSSLLRGDATINSVKRQLQNVLTSTVNNNGQFRILAEIGITSNTDGTLSQDNTELDEALSENFDDLVSLIAGDDEADGVMKNFNSLLLDLTSSVDGMYATQEDSYDSKMDRYDYQMDLMEIRLSKRETTLRAQFSAMETLVSQLNSEGDFITQAFESLE